MIELNTRICRECNKVFCTPGRDQLCYSCKAKHRKAAMKRQAEITRKPHVKEAKPPKVSLEQEQKVERIYNAIHKSRYHHYGEIVQIIEETKTDRCVCCGDIIPEGRLVCPNCERMATDD